MGEVTERGGHCPGCEIIIWLMSPATQVVHHYRNIPRLSAFAEWSVNIVPGSGTWPAIELVEFVVKALCYGCSDRVRICCFQLRNKRI